MNDGCTKADAPRTNARSRLVRKYAVSMAAVVCAASLAVGLAAIVIFYDHHRNSLIRIQHEQADAAAEKIGQFVGEIERQLGWTVQLPWAATTLNERRIDALRLLRQVPAITELALLDNEGREQLRVSRLAVDIIGSGIDRSHEPVFLEAEARRVFHGPVYLHRESEPYMTLALAGPRGDAGVSVASVNLKFIWDVVSRIKVGNGGAAYVVNAEGRLIAHPDISLVLRNTDLSELAQVRAALSGGVPSSAQAKDLNGHPVFAVHAAIAPLGWIVLAELPAVEALAPATASVVVIGLILLGALALALFAAFLLARRMVTPIRLLQHGAARVGAGALDHRMTIRTGDELEGLAGAFNSMAARLQDSYATLEDKVVERTHQLELANLAKSRFVAAASHDLRQPLHALNLFVAQLKAAEGKGDRARLVAKIETAIATMNELFNALLDISRLDAGVLTPSIAAFPVQRLLDSIETTFAAAAAEKGLALRVVPGTAWVRSDAVLLERIMLNLVSNAVRYTERGGVVIGCRRRGDLLRLEVWDSGVGIAQESLPDIFGEFTRLPTPAGGAPAGLGLGLAIVDRLARLLDHPVEVVSRMGRGSCFSIAVPIAASRAEAERAPPTVHGQLPATRFDGGKVVLVLDDDAQVRDAMQGLLESWGLTVLAAQSLAHALALVGEHGRAPDLVISDYRLARGETGFDAIALLDRAGGGEALPAFLISGDTAPERLKEAQASGYRLLHKPVSPMTLRAMVSRYLAARAHSLIENRGDAEHPQAPADPSRARARQ